MRDRRRALAGQNTIPTLDVREATPTAPPPPRRSVVDTDRAGITTQQATNAAPGGGGALVAMGAIAVVSIFLLMRK